MTTGRFSHKAVQALSPRSGFTLIELLAVILIIGVLVTLVSSAVMAAKSNANRKHREMEMTALKGAIQNYRYEYQKWPCETPVSTTNNKDVFAYLKCREDLGAPNDKNPRDIKFVNFGEYKFSAIGNIIDYTRTPYRVTITFTSDTVSVTRDGL